MRIHLLGHRPDVATLLEQLGHTLETVPPYDAVVWAGGELPVSQLPVPVLALSAAPASAYRSGAHAVLPEQPDAEQLAALLDGLPELARPAFDEKAALAAMGDPTVVKMVIDVFLTEAPKLFDDVKASFRKGPVSALARAAHRFAGGIAMFGDSPCHRLFLAVERAAESEQPHRAAYFQMEASYKRLYAVLQDRQYG